MEEKLFWWFIGLIELDQTYQHNTPYIQLNCLYTLNYEWKPPEAEEKECTYVNEWIKKVIYGFNRDNVHDIFIIEAMKFSRMKKFFFPLRKPRSLLVRKFP